MEPLQQVTLKRQLCETIISAQLLKNWLAYGRNSAITRSQPWECRYADYDQHPVSRAEIEEKICKWKVKKATGPDGVSARFLKYAGMSSAPSLTSVFKQSVEVCKPPDQWKIARVSAAFKKGREEDRTCYRPLSMLSIPSKLMESCIASNITNHVVTQNLLDNRQWAYRKGKSTEQLLIHLTERWREAVERKLFVGILFVDFTKAFDTVSHNILLQKLNDLGIRGDIWLWLKNYLTERKKLVRINGGDSDTNIITHGVPQGSVLGPIILVLAFHKLPPKIATLRGNLFVCRQNNNILYRRNDGFANKHTKQSSSWTPGMVRQKFNGTIPRKM